MALGAPCFLDDGGDSSGVAVGDRISNGEIDPVGVSNGSGVGEVFFFRCGEALGESMGEVVFFFGLGDGDSNSSSVDELLFFRGDGVTDGVGDSLSRAGDDFFDGLGDGVGDFFVVADELFFFRGFGVGVGVERIFLMASPNDCSARTGASSESRIEMTMQRRIDMEQLDEAGLRFLETTSALSRNGSKDNS
ncbi:MAG: hypothetical protein WA183_04880 [Chthoniobacterales bacterium]